MSNSFFQVNLLVKVKMMKLFLIFASIWVLIEGASVSVFAKNFWLFKKLHFNSFI